MFDDIPFLLAFTGGLVATVNPCGFAMLPAYLSFFLGLTGAGAGAGRTVGAGQALRVGVTVAGGFLLVFGLAWILLAAGIRALISLMPWAALLVGTAVFALGVWLLTGRPMPIRLPTPGRAADGSSAGAVFLFGLGYAVASLSCTLPVFLAVVAGTATRRSLGSGLAVFGVYAVGMALPLLALTVALAVGRDAFVRRARSLSRVVNRLAGVLLVVAGLYVVAYWGTELTGVTGGPLASGVAGLERLAAHLARVIGGSPELSGLVLASVVALAAAASWWARRGAHRKERAS